MLSCPRKYVTGRRGISNGHCQLFNREAGLAGVKVQTLSSQRHDRSINAPFDENMPGLDDQAYLLFVETFRGI